MHAPLDSASCTLTTELGTFRLCGYTDRRDGLEHAALVFGDLTAPGPVLARIHSECLTGDTFHSLHCDCGKQLDAALEAIAEAGDGVLLYLRQEGRGIGLLNKIRAYALQEQGADTVDANRLLGLPDDARDYAFAVEILRDLGVTALRLITNNPAKIEALTRLGMTVVERVPAEATRHRRNAAYLDTKAARMGHLFGTDRPGDDRPAPQGIAKPVA